MAANQTIKELMAAESKASKIITQARQERGERLKQAKAEAEEEIKLYRTQQENAFQLSNTDLLKSDESVLEQEAQDAIARMRNEFKSNEASVVAMMVQHAASVHLRVPEGRKA